ncbi:hypothetical protein GCM10029992_46520 [Glycomyces albus]
MADMGRPRNSIRSGSSRRPWRCSGPTGTRRPPRRPRRGDPCRQGSLYNAFGSKRELFGKALDCYGRAGAELTEDFLFRPGTAKERIRAYLRFIVDVDLAGPVRRGCLAANTALELGGRDEEARSAVKRMEEQTIALFTARIEQGKREGDVAGEVDAEAQARFLMNTVVGLRVMAKTHEAPDLHEIIETALSGL